MDEPHAVREHSSDKGTGVWAGASLVAALLASACCLGPVMLSALGLSALGVSAAFEPLRPYLLGVTVLLLGVGFYFAYFRQPVCAPGETCAVQNPQLTRVNRGLLWVATLAVLIVGLSGDLDFFNVSAEVQSVHHLPHERHGWLMVRAAFKIEHLNVHTQTSETF